jgi:hypothetical protein
LKIQGINLAVCFQQDVENLSGRSVRLCKFWFGAADVFVELLIVLELSLEGGVELFEVDAKYDGRYVGEAKQDFLSR